MNRISMRPSNQILAEPHSSWRGKVRIGRVSALPAPRAPIDLQPDRGPLPRDGYAVAYVASAAPFAFPLRA